MNEIEGYVESVLLRPLKERVEPLENQLSRYNPAIEKLLEMGLLDCKVADLGCGNGERTIELLLKLRAKEIVGIDIDQQNIDRAQSWIDQILLPIQPEILKIRQILQSGQVESQVSGATRKRVDELLNKFGAVPVPVYRHGDITEGEESTRLQTAYFDLAYCRCVLYHIYCDEKEEEHPKTRSAIKEMVRIVKAGGIIVAYEPNICSASDNTKVNLTPLFDDQQNIQLVEKIAINTQTIYIYCKE